MACSCCSLRLMRQHMKPEMAKSTLITPSHNRWTLVVKLSDVVLCNSKPPEATCLEGVMTQVTVTFIMQIDSGAVTEQAQWKLLSTCWIKVTGDQHTQ